ncbi:glycosyltransferase family 2 protein [Kitasatospora xanthocidica]|uniref:Glycosyltransferase family 2 protein n=1 Tax=Kitasatospora xanthocidica TaxID=83382 RepID=A0A372ZXS8_9ACTN|nr:MULTISPECIES: glycosyltransferase family 2 protein [Streptomycetaceae]OKI04244.1 glycosyl transferase [Streptomyces sp. CB02056]RGD60127.1 glycosyltransferase family 2 protein [Kitasatospora xanthocidica]
MSQYDDVWLVIPAYNEGQVIADVVEGARKTFPNIVVVDDGSGDDSAKHIMETGAHLVRHPVNLGQGAALQTGLAYALAQPGAKYFATFDADGQHQTADVEKMVALLREGDTDVVLGSRFIEQNGQVPWIKRVVLRTAATVSPTARKLKLTDAHNGLRVLNREAAGRLRITMNGMAHASEIVSFLAGSDLRVAELPVDILYTDYSRAKGQSLINGVNIIFDISLRERSRR